MTYPLSGVRRCARLAARALLLAAAALPFPVLAQQPAPLPKPNVALWTNGAVSATALMPDGDVVIGGAFDAVNGVPRKNIARVNPDGTVDTWNPGVDSTVLALTVDAAGDVYVGGFFTRAGGLSRQNIAKLSGTGNGDADATWNPAAGGGSVGALLLDGNGWLYAAGSFTFIGGASRNRLAKLSTSGAGSSDGLWNPNPAGSGTSVEALAYDATNDALYFGGRFSTVGGTTRINVAKVSGSGAGALDMAWNPGAGGSVFALALDGGSVYAGGFFSSFGGVSRSGIARVSATTGADEPAFQATFGDGVQSLAIDGPHLYVGGSNTQFNGATQTPRAMRLFKADGSADSAFAPRITVFGMSHIAVYGDFVYLAGPQFNIVDDEVRLGVAKLDKAGALQAPIDAMTPAVAYALLPLGDGSTIIGGNFFYAGTTVRATLAKITAAGDVDPMWAPKTDGSVQGLALSHDGGAVYVNGDFRRAGGQARFTAAKFSTSGAGDVDIGWDPGADGTVSALAANAAGDVYIGGRYTQIGGGFRNNIAKVSGTTGALDPLWGPGGANGQGIFELVVAPNGALFVSGIFTTINGQSKTNFAKLDATTGVTDPTWTANLGMFEVVRQIVFSGDTMYVAGNYSTINGAPRKGLAKLTVSSPATLDASWTPTPNFPEVETITLAPDGALIVAGGFSMVNGQERLRLAKIATDATGTLDPEWTPSLTVETGGIIIGGATVNLAGNVVAGGSFTSASGVARQGVAAFPSVVVKPDPVFLDGFE